MKNYFETTIDGCNVIHNAENFIGVEKADKDLLITFGEATFDEEFGDFNIKGSVRLNNKEFKKFIKLLNDLS